MEGRPDLNPGDEAPPGEPSAGENLCPICSGLGDIDGHRCDNCGGSGKIEAGIGGA
jgi:DnaJ-class molecular chaperone